MLQLWAPAFELEVVDILSLPAVCIFSVASRKGLTQLLSASGFSGLSFTKGKSYLICIRESCNESLTFAKEVVLDSSPGKIWKKFGI
jgi:hypothetical protein